MWREMIIGWNVGCTFSDPATSSEIDDLEKTFGIQIPEHLKELLLESNGITGTYGLDVVWSTAGIKGQNLDMRHDKDFQDMFMPFDHLLFFGSNGAGDYYGYPISAAQTISGSEIFCWYHENDDRIVAAFSLEAYLNEVLHYGSDK